MVERSATRGTSIEQQRVSSPEVFGRASAELSRVEEERTEDLTIRVR